MTLWPKQSECDEFYGDPRGRNGQVSIAWESSNIVPLFPPFKMTYDSRPIKSIRVHRKCKDSLQVVLDRIWVAADHEQERVDSWGISIFGGSFNYRLMRGLNTLSMHSYGCAIDFDPARNALHDKTPHFENVPEVLRAFESEGWVWGGRWSRPDGMHFQAARVK